MMYPINTHLKSIIDKILTDARWDMKFIGMQIVIEGLALSAFNTTRETTPDPVLKDVEAVAIGQGVPPAQVGLAWLMAKGVRPVIGATKPQHIEDAIAATALTLSEDDIDHLEQSYTPRPFAELPWDLNKNEDPRLKTPDLFE